MGMCAYINLYVYTFRLKKTTKRPLSHLKQKKNWVKMP